MATEAVSTHPTEMHSCLNCKIELTMTDVSDESAFGSVWHQMSGRLVQLSVREETGQLWGVNIQDNIWSNVNTHLGL